MQYKYAFLHKVFYQRIVSTRLLSGSSVRILKDGKFKIKVREKHSVIETVSTGKSITITLESKWSLMQHIIKTNFILNL